MNTYLSAIGCLLACSPYAATMNEFNYMLIRGGFAFANGALALAVPLYQNSIVFHDVDNLASVFIHTSPAWLFWALRWGAGHGTSLIQETWPDMFQVCINMSDTKELDAPFTSFRNMLWHSGPCGANAMEVREFVSYPAMCWAICWGIPYYVFVLCLFRGYLERNKKKTLYTYTIEYPQGNGKFITKLPKSLWPLGYMLQHFLFTVLTGFCSIIMWNSFIIHTLFLFLIALKAVHNGSTFMFRQVALKRVMSKVNTFVAKQNEQNV